MKKNYPYLLLLSLIAFSNIFCNKNEYSRECGAPMPAGTSIEFGCFVPFQITGTNCQFSVGLVLSQMAIVLDMRVKDAEIFLERLKAAKSRCEPVCIALFEKTRYISKISPASPEIIDQYKSTFPPCNGE